LAGTPTREKWSKSLAKFYLGNSVFVIMKRCLFAIILFHLLVLQSFGQTINKAIICDTPAWYGSYRSEVKQLALQNLLCSADSIHFRYSTDNRLVDIYSQDGVTYYGTARTFTYKVYNKRGKRVTPEIFWNNMQVDTAVANQIHNLVQNNHALIFTRDSTKHNRMCCDCTSYNFELATPKEYCFKSYEAVIDSNDIELKMAERFADVLDSLLSLNKLHEDLFKKLPRGCAYMYTGPIVVTIPTVRYVLFKRRPNMDKRYLDSIADTLNTYLSDTLTKLLWKYGEFACGGDIFLKFSRDNKLLKIIPSAKLGELEKKDFQNCQQKVTEAFKFVTLDFIHSRIGYQKRLTYFEGNVRIFD